MAGAGSDGESVATTEAAVGEFLGMVASYRSWRDGLAARPSITFKDFRQIVRRYRPSDLLPALASLALATGAADQPRASLASVAPWAIALTARESILYGNEFRREAVTGESLRLVMNAHNNIYEKDPITAFDPLDLLTRLAYEQFPYQESDFEEVSRSHVLLIEGAAEVSLEVLTPEAWIDVLGFPLGEIVGATFLLHVAAHVNAGWFDAKWLDRDDLGPIIERWPLRLVNDRAMQISSTFDQFKAAYNTVPHPPSGYERFAYNPLVRRPFVRMQDGRMLAPQPRLILRTVSPGALYYQGMEKFGEAFGRDLGKLTEHYVGKQLRSIDPEIELHPEIVYRIKKDQYKSIDWFLVLPSVVVMFEVKSARFGLLERAGFDGYQKRVKSILDRATEQLARSSEAIERGEPAFGHIPGGRLQIGIIVTGEPFYLANSPFVREKLADAPFPTMVASLREIEMLVSLPLDEIERQLLSIAQDPERSTWTLGTSIDMAKSKGRNEVLDRAWNSYPWPTSLPTG